jgi:hypothetical protein
MSYVYMPGMDVFKPNRAYMGYVRPEINNAAVVC